MLLSVTLNVQQKLWCFFFFPRFLGRFKFPAVQVSFLENSCKWFLSDDMRKLPLNASSTCSIDHLLTHNRHLLQFKHSLQKVVNTLYLLKHSDLHCWCHSPKFSLLIVSWTAELCHLLHSHWRTTQKSWILPSNLRALNEAFTFSFRKKSSYKNKICV